MSFVQSLRFLAAAALLLQQYVPSALAAGSSPKSRGKGLNLMSNGFIVEFTEPNVPTHVMARDVPRHVSSTTGVKISHRMELRSSIFNGASFNIHHESARGSTDEALEAALMQMPNVAAVYPNALRKLNAPVDFETFPTIQDTRSGYLPNDKLLGGRGEQMPTYYGTEGTPLVNPHAMTGVDRLHSEGLTGQGMKIAIIDTGIDAYHPVFGGEGIGPGLKVAGGYDFMGDQSDDNINPPVPDDSPQTVCANHGTFVSSIAAGLPYKYGFVGVAPNATLYSYKVFPCKGYVTTDIGVNASLTAYEAGVDVINASVGSQGGWANDLWSIVAARIMANGTVYMFSASNDGDLGLFISNAVASNPGTVAIGSVDNAYTATLVTNGSYSINDGPAIPIEYAPGFPANWTMPLEVISLDITDCEPIPTNWTYAPNQVIVLPRPPVGSTCNQSAQVSESGIRNVLMYNYFDYKPTRPLPIQNTDGFPFWWLDGIAYVDYTLGRRLVNLAVNGSKVTLDLPWKPNDNSKDRRLRLLHNDLTGGFMSNYSTWGPTYEANLGPAFSAPGGWLLGAAATIYGGLSVGSGTSFSAPYAAGAAALMKQANPALKPYEIISRMASTAKPMKMQLNQRQTMDYLAPVFQQGGGLLDAWAAVHTTTSVNVSSLAFNDTEYNKPLSFQLTYDGPLSGVTYEITHVPGPTLYTYSPGNRTVTPFSNDTAFPLNILPDAPATLHFSQSSVGPISPGSSASITVTATPPAGLDPERLPLYSGFISIRGSNNDSLSLPYGGIGSRLRDVPVLDTTRGQNRTYLVANYTEGDVARPGLGNNLTTVFKIPRVVGNITTSTTLTDVMLPGYFAQPLFGSLQLNASLVSRNGTDLGLISPVITLRDLQTPQPKYFVRDAGYISLFYGKLLNGSYVSDGVYRFKIRMLRVRGDPNVLTDWDEALTQPFTLRYV